MPVYKSEPFSDKPTVPEDIYELEVDSIEEIERTFGTNEDGSPKVNKRVAFRFAIQDPGPYQGQVVRGETPANFVPDDRCKLWNWAQEILAKRFPPDYELNTDHLVGKRCRGLVSVKERRDGNGHYNLVTDLLRAKPRAYEEKY